MARKAIRKGKTTTISVYTEDAFRLKEIARAKHIPLANALRLVLDRWFQ
jgi:hypothetical protein